MAATKGIGRPLTILLRADNTGLAKGLQTAEGQLKAFGKKTEAAARTATLALAGIGAAAYTSVQAASALNESINKSNVVFGDSAKSIQNWAATADKSLGLSQVAAQEAAANFATLGQSAGLTGNELVVFSKDLTTLASDLASFNDTSVDEAITALAAGLRGESEPLRRFNVLLSDNAVQNEAMRLGLKNTKKELTEQDKVLARSSLIMEQTVKQQGDFARTADSAANLQRTLAGTIENTKAKIGQGLLPAYQELLQTLIPAADYFAKNSTQILSVGKVAAITAASIIALNLAIKAGIIVTQIATTTAAGLRLSYLTLATATGNLAAKQALAELTYKNVTIAARLYAVATGIATTATKLAEIGIKGLTKALLLNPFTYVITGALLAADALYKWQQSTLDTAKATEQVGGYYDKQAGRLLLIADAADLAARGVDNLAKTTSNAAQESRDAARSQGRNTSTYVSSYASIREQIAKLKTANIDSYNTSSKLDKARKKDRQEAERAAKAAAKAERVAERLRKQQEALAATKKAFDDYASGVKNALAAQFSFQSAFEEKGKGSFLEALKKQAAAAIAFSGKIAKLVSLGLSRGSVDQVLAAGPQIGGQIADELLKGGAGAISDVNSLVASVNAVTGQTGGAVSSALGGRTGSGNINITINGAIDPEGVRRSLEKLFQDSARRTSAMNFVGATL